MRLDQTSWWQCDTLSSPLELFAKSLWDSQVMKDFDFVCFPQRKYTDYGSCVYNKITSADWFYEAFNNSLATESGMLRLQSGCLFVGIGHFDDSSNTDHLTKNSEHPFLQTILNLTLECHIVNHLTLGCWCLYYLILRWVISKSSLNQITSRMVIICPFIAWNCTTNTTLSFCILHSKILTSIMVNLWVNCMVLAGCKSTFKWVWS
jgi:hypothetical protein